MQAGLRKGLPARAGRRISGGGVSSALRRSRSPSPQGADAALLVLRLAFGLGIALGHGLGKIGNLGGFIGNVARQGVPLPEVLGPAAALSELVGGILLAIGLFTRPAAVFVLATMLVAGFHIHAADPFPKKELAFAYAFVSIALLLAGPGRFSLDARIFGRR